MSIVINGKPCRTVGSITMDSLIVDITDVENSNLISPGTYLELINEDFLNKVRVN